MNNRVVIYEGIDGHKEIAIKATLRECFNWGGLGICDWCNEQADETVYLCPELGHKASCEKCFEKHQSRVKWYPEDYAYIKDTLREFVDYYKLLFNDLDIRLVDDFIQEMDSEYNGK